MPIVDPVTVRIPELPAQVALSLADKLPVWVAEDNKTRHASLQDIRTLIMTGGSGSHPPVYVGGSIIYRVPLDTPPETQIASIPSLAGKDFVLRREGRALIPQNPFPQPPRPDAEYEVLDGGGFKLLLEEDYLIPGERFELDVFQLQGAAPSPGAPGSSLITGVVPITVNTTLNPTDHLNKLIQLRAGSSQVAVTLMDVDDVPANTIVVIEATILNTFQNRITTQGGQFIYMNNQSYTSVYIAIGETLWLFRYDDGWYVINDSFAQGYARVGKVEASYKVGINEVAADGTLLSRAAHPRLWAFAQTTGASIVSDATWLTASVNYGGQTVPWPYRGCYSTGDGSTTFRVPDLKNVALRGLLTFSGSDSQRYLNAAGGFQLNQYPAHSHVVPIPPDKTRQNQEGTGFIVGGAGGGQEPGALASLQTDSSGGTESRMDNTGIIWTIKE